jgi:ABC-type cobalamin/Fe3+-siderophores transport system ATPase subunit
MGTTGRANLEGGEWRKVRLVVQQTNVMDLPDIGGFSLKNMARINVILGKNGCGKSHLLKQLEQGLNSLQRGKVRYISPERGGLLQYQANIEQSINDNPEWMVSVRRRNQSENFRQQSAVLFRRLELLELRGIEREQAQPGYVPRTFDYVVDALNVLLDRVRLERDAVRAFRIVDRESGEQVSPEQISSGESELISLGIEFLAFVRECQADDQNVLLVDEPDVHLHPDLQDRLSKFIARTITERPLSLIVATHSTALLAGLAQCSETRVAFMRRKDVELNFRAVSDVDRLVLPIFGAHPLSNIFNEKPILLLEGEDDGRLWQQAVRSSMGGLKIYPCHVEEGVTALAGFEAEVNLIIETVYDDARGYSLRDRDSQGGDIADVGRIVRMRLSCRAAENLMLSDDVLSLAAVDWPVLQAKIREWVDINSTHKYHPQMKAFAEDGFDRKNHDLKEIRNIVVSFISSKPWEVLVGQAIAGLVAGSGDCGADSLRNYLGEKVCSNVLRLTPMLPSSQGEMREVLSD